ncbi:uncharacterized protein G2W53_021813 [Senna tora]|uniref:Secreted protein n=1 Tax=Senna tora TaxID=362788 RepID=A0A834WNQ1_9FABA|nr:uncharacterized protein G2W53_021813 [Senna tora]
MQVTMNDLALVTLFLWLLLLSVDDTCVKKKTDPKGEVRYFDLFLPLQKNAKEGKLLFLPFNERLTKTDPQLGAVGASRHFASTRGSLSLWLTGCLKDARFVAKQRTAPSRGSFLEIH